LSDGKIMASTLRSLSAIWNGEKIVLTALQRHVELSVQAAEKLTTLITQVSSGDTKSARETCLEIDRLETTADKIHKQVMELASSGVFFSGLSVELINLTKNIDDIADNVKGAARALTYRSLNPKEFSGLVGMIQSYIAVCIKAAEALKMAVESLGKSKSEVIKFIEETEKYEEAADEVKEQLIEELYRLDLPILSIIQLKDFIFLVDNVADFAEDSGDVIQVMLSKGYS
jgi:predicted phosphate transport protein (TIGR00153 family)